MFDRLGVIRQRVARTWSGVGLVVGGGLLLGCPTPPGPARSGKQPETANAELAARVEYLEQLIVDADLAGRVGALEQMDADGRLTAVESTPLLALASFLEVDTGERAVRFVGANVYVQSGSGATDDWEQSGGELSGLGNLIVGYDEDDADMKSGSHNLVVGMGHTYTSYAGLVAGHHNEIAGWAASVTGGADNAASGSFATVSGGEGNAASGEKSAVLGGANGSALGNDSTIAGGNWASAEGNFSSVMGGLYGSATGECDVTIGGYYASANGQYAVQVGGQSPPACVGAFTVCVAP